MKVTSMTVRRAVKIDVKNHENTDVDVSLTVSLDEGEDATEVYQTIAQNVRDLVRAELDAIAKASRFGV